MRKKARIKSTLRAGLLRTRQGNDFTLGVGSQTFLALTMVCRELNQRKSVLKITEVCVGDVSFKILIYELQVVPGGRK
jgi:hypothetical protein